MLVNKISHLQNIKFKGDVAEVDKTEEIKPKEQGQKTDSVEIKKKEKPPEISTSHLFWGRLSDEEIEQVNKARMLPSNGKFVANGMGGYRVAANFLNFTIGTRKLPEGFEVRKTVTGFTTVLPKDSEGAFIKSKSTADTELEEKE